MLIALLLLAMAAPARADVQVIDAPTGAARVLVASDYAQVHRWTDDGGALVMTVGGKRYAVAIADGSRTVVPAAGSADSTGPGGRTITHEAEGYVLRSADGTVVATVPAQLWVIDEYIAWSRDGSRVAISSRDGLVVLDAATGAVVLRRNPAAMTEQAFAPDGAALVASRDGRVLRIDLPSGAETELYHGREDFPRAAWSATGRIAITRDDGIGVLGHPGIHVSTSTLTPALWSPDGTLLRFPVVADSDGCSYPRIGLVVAAPGEAPRTVVAPSDRELVSAEWSPVAPTLAVQRGLDPGSADRRGKRHPWPKRIATDYAMFSSRADAAVRRLVVRAARALKRGAGREDVLSRVRLDWARLDERYDELGDTAARDALANELDRWLHAAGFERIEAFDEITC